MLRESQARTTDGVSRDCTGRMVTLNVSCYVAVAVQADRLVNSRLRGSAWAFLYLSSLIPRVGGQGWIRLNGQTALVERQAAWEYPGPSEHTIPSQRAQPLARNMGPFP